MKKIIALTILAFLVWRNSSGQEFIVLQEAFSRCYSYEKEGKYTEAISELSKIYDENSYEINLRLGWLTYNAGSYLESIDFYKKAIVLKPYAIEPRYGLISPAVAVGNYNLVEEQYLKILTIDPLNSKANYWMGVIYYNREQYDIALKYLEKVVNLYPFDYDSTIMFAWTHYKMGNLREAKLMFQQALLINPGDDSAQQGLSQIQ